MERETGIEPATNSLEGCDSTTELLPPTRLAASPAHRYGGVSPPHCFNRLATFTRRVLLTCGAARSAACRQRNKGGEAPPTNLLQSSAPTISARCAGRKVGGEGRVRTSVARRRQVYSLLRLTALPPPRKSVGTSRRTRALIRPARSRHDRSGPQHLNSLRPCTMALEPAHVMESVYPVLP
jgi:hypothetical protein